MTVTLDPFELVHRIGRGGMGEVHLALDTRLQRNVALKLLPADLAADPERRARSLPEAQAAAALNRPHITTTLDIGEEDGRDYIAQEFINGRPLSETIAERSLPLDALVDLAVPPGRCPGCCPRERRDPSRPEGCQRNGHHSR